MKKLILAALPIVAIAIMALRPVSDPLPIGSPLPKPDKKMRDISGKEISFTQAMKKNGLMIMFSCNTCPVVKKYQPRTNEICQYALDNSFGVVLLNPNEANRDDGDSFDDMKDYGKRESYKWYYTVDQNSEMADAFGATRTPEVFLFDKDGKLAYRGAIDDNQNDAKGASKLLRSAMEALMAGKDVAVKTSRSVGCSIKRL